MLAGVDPAFDVCRHEDRDRADRNLDLAVGRDVGELRPQLGAVSHEPQTRGRVSQRAAAAWNVERASVARSVKVSTQRC